SDERRLGGGREAPRWASEDVVPWWIFFFQAEDGIRDGHVTGVQTCALPICPPARSGCRPADPARQPDRAGGPARAGPARRDRARSEERRVGKEGRRGGAAAH